MRCSDIINKLEELSPTSYAEDWDNVGLLAGRTDKEVRVIAIALDATESVIAEAIRCKADMLITHHPLIFKPMNRVTASDFIGRRVVSLLQADISYYAMHTNFDVMGMADAAADEIELQNRQVLHITYEDEIAKEGIGRFGRLPQTMSLVECANYIKSVFLLEGVLTYGDLEAEVTHAAIVPGSGADMIKDAIEAGVDVMITGDIKHHEAIDALEQGLYVIDAGHYGIEKIFVPYIKQFLSRESPSLEVHIVKEQNPIQIIR
ncbi:MAG: Nif3-like dinuclear metal center hexameric protein [Lachnospiraceae bacterium]